LRSREIAHTPVMPGLPRALWRTPPDAVVHAHVAHAFIPDVAVAVARRRGQPVLAHYHLDVDPTGAAGRLLLRPYQRTLLRRTLRHSDAVVVPTPDYAELVAAVHGVPGERIRVIPNGTDFAVAARPRSVPAGSWRLISVGRLSPQKQFPLLFAACAALRERRPQLLWTLDVYGDGDLRVPLEREIDRLGLGGLVHVRGGGLSRAQLRDRYDEADLFVLATGKESFGIVFAEAMARGLPVVATDVPGVRNVVRDGVHGRLAQPRPAALADAMAGVMADPAEYTRLSAQALAGARVHTWPRIAGQFAALYQEITQGVARAAGGSAGRPG
jgi:glycosyltransferase involved in cell wall biosynthesis